MGTFFSQCSAIRSVLTSYHKAKDIKYMAVSSKYFWKFYNVPKHLLSFTGQLQNWDCDLWCDWLKNEQKTEIKHQICCQMLWSNFVFSGGHCSSFDKEAVRIKCHNCGSNIITDVRKEISGLQWILSGFLCIMGCVPCCIFPLFIDNLKEVIQNLHWKLGQQMPSAWTILAYLEATA